MRRTLTIARRLNEAFPFESGPDAFMFAYCGYGSFSPSARLYLTPSTRQNVLRARTRRAALIAEHPSFSEHETLAEPKDLVTPENLALAEEIGLFVEAALDAPAEQQRVAPLLRELEGLRLRRDRSRRQGHPDPAVLHAVAIRPEDAAAQRRVRRKHKS